MKNTLFRFILLGLITLIQLENVSAQLMPASTLKDENDEAILQSWLGPNYYGVKLYTKSINGASGTIFHQLCDGQGPTITLIRNSQNNVVFGGYSNGDWSGYPSAGGTGSFVFNLSTNTKLDYIPSTQQATSPYGGYGPIFSTSFEVYSDMSQMNAGNNQQFYCSSGSLICQDILFNQPGQSISPYSYSSWVPV
ncbi:MAG: hypothetical protein RL521_950, partial [Bacteroidota bacterium]